jgi:Holliday junction DNA helicase RuvA
VIGRLTGEVIERKPDLLLLNVGGVGYEVNISLTTFGQLAETEGLVTIHTHLIVRDDAHILFGFGSINEREMFRALIKVNSVGPKMALTILSGLEAEAFAGAILSGDLKTLTGLPGVGKKTAERLIVEMKDKVDAFSVSGTGISSRMRGSVAEDAESALVGLGYKPQIAADAITQIEDPAEDVQTLIKQALKALMQR